jgi:hypothetical protein
MKGLKVDQETQTVEREGRAIDSLNRNRLSKPKRHRKGAKRGNPEREEFARPVIHYPIPPADRPDWLNNLYRSPAGSS